MNTYWQKLITIVKDNPKIVIWILGILASVLTVQTGWKFTVKSDPNAVQPEIIIIWPDSSDPTDIFNDDKVIQAPIQDDNHLSGESLTVLRKTGNTVLKRRDNGSPRLFELIKNLHNNPTREGVDTFAQEVKAVPYVLIAKIVIKVMIVGLEKMSPETKTKLDDYLLEILKSLN
jgi:hypothetical protein